MLGLQSPWTVSRVHLDVTGQCVDMWAEHPEDGAWACPHGSKTLPLYDHAEERTSRHLDSCQFQTHLQARIPRVECDEHGVIQVTVPWAEPRARFTLLFERFAITVLSQCDVSGATRVLRVSWDEAWGLMQRAVTRGRARKQARIVRRIGADEKAAEKIVLDRFHIMGPIGKAVDTGRKQEHQELMESGDETLKGSKLYSRRTYLSDGARNSPR